MNKFNNRLVALLLFIMIFVVGCSNKTEVIEEAAGNEKSSVDENVIEEKVEDESNKDIYDYLDEMHETIVLDYPNEEDIIDVDNYVEFYNNYTKDQDDKWYRITIPIYTKTHFNVIAFEGFDGWDDMISVDLVNESDSERIHVGDNVTFVAHSDQKFLCDLMLNSAYVEKIEETEYTIYEDRLIVIDDYVDFATNYTSHDIGKYIQITAPIYSLGSDYFIVKEGFPDDWSSGIWVYVDDISELENIREGDIVSFTGTTESKFGKALTMHKGKIVDSDGIGVWDYNTTCSEYNLKKLNFKVHTNWAKDERENMYAFYPFEDVNQGSLTIYVGEVTNPSQEQFYLKFISNLTDGRTEDIYSVNEIEIDDYYAIETSAKINMGGEKQDAWIYMIFVDNDAYTIIFREYPSISDELEEFIKAFMKDIYFS